MRKDFQEGYDVDFFAMDQNQYLIHFASGGSRIPESIYGSDKFQEMVFVFCEKLPIISDVVVNSQIDAIKKFDSETKRHLYLSSFINMASRGLYSFDNCFPGKSISLQYNLVASPKIPLMKSDVPSEILKDLYRLSVDIIECTLIDFKEIVKE